MRVFLVSALAVVALLGNVLADGNKEKPAFCHGLDCPDYKVLDVVAGFELREYKKAAWVSTRVEGHLLETALTAGFKRLYDYISGENEDQAKINMTAPVRTRVDAGAGPFCKSNFTVSFYAGDVEDAPTPTNPDVRLEVTPEMSVFVAEFGGFAITPIITSNAENVTKTVTSAGYEVEEDFYFFAGYDSPFRLTGRHNEVWVIKKGDDAALTQ